MDGKPRAAILDLDAAVIDSRPAWRYALEEAVMMITGERADTAPLIDEYRHRPWGHVVPILVHKREDQARCVQLCERFYRRSALKRLLVFEGIGMALDQLRGGGIELGVVTRETHPDAMRQIESTGVDRFLTVLAPTNDGVWDARRRFAECLRYLETAPELAVYVSPVATDLASVAAAGATPVHAGWCGPDAEHRRGVEHPSGLWRAIFDASLTAEGR